MKLRARFSSIEKALKYFSKKLQSYPLDEAFWDNEVYELFKHHPRFYEKTRGMKVTGFVRRRNPKNLRTWSIHAVLEDGTEVDWSYRKCVYNMFGNYDRKRDILAAFRKAVENQIIEFKKSRLILGRLVRTDSGKVVSSEKAHVHHEPPFEELVEEFLKERGFRLEDIPIKEAEDGIQYIIADKKLENEWREFHKKRAKLKLLTKEEHELVHKYK